MQLVSLKRFRSDLTRFIRSRRPVTITDRGRPIARLIPIRASAKRKDRVALLGLCGLGSSGGAAYDLDEVAYGPSPD